MLCDDDGGVLGAEQSVSVVWLDRCRLGGRLPERPRRMPPSMGVAEVIGVDTWPPLFRWNSSNV